ncbi:MAG TPA: hypothetical protein VNK05_02875 [Chloroflexota bacterium]|nr:hypothetical protein [Chloroflexota bacterium]
MAGERTAGQRRGQPDADGAGGSLLLLAARQRTVLLSGFLAGLCVFFAPLVVLGIGLLAAYLVSVASDGSGTVFDAGRTLDRADFQGVFAPAVNHAPLLVVAGLIGALLAAFRRWLGGRAARAGRGRRGRVELPYFREFAFLYAVMVGLVLGLALTSGGWPQALRLLNAAPAFVLLMFCATWLAQAVWSYCFGNIIELLASRGERDAAAAMRGRGRRLGPRSSHA